VDVLSVATGLLGAYASAGRFADSIEGFVHAALQIPGPERGLPQLRVEDTRADQLPAQGFLVAVER
jgi:hypothetical protein